MADPIQSISSAISRARSNAGLTQAQLGASVGADRFAIAALEKGQVTTQVRRLVAVLDTFGLELTVTARPAGAALPPGGEALPVGGAHS